MPTYICQLCPAKQYKTRKNAHKHTRQAHGYRVQILTRYR